MTSMQHFKARTTAVPTLLGLQEADEVRLAGLRQRIRGLPSEAIPEFWQTFSPYRGWMPEQRDKTAFGALLPADGDPDGFDYFTAVEVGGFRKINSDWDTLAVPPQRYAVFAHRDHVSALRPALHTIFAQSLPGLNLVPRRHVPDVPLLLERYDETFDLRTGWGGIQVWVPLEDH